MKGTASDVSVYNIVFWNDVFALLAVFALHRQLGGFRKTLQTRYLKFHLLRSVLLTLQFICLIFALAAMPMANSYSLFLRAPHHDLSGHSFPERKSASVSLDIASGRNNRHSHYSESGGPAV